MTGGDTRRVRSEFSSLTEVADACRRLRLHLEKHSLADAAEITAAWPDDEAAAQPLEWVSVYGQMMRMKGEANGRGAGGAGADAEAAALAALMDEPEPVLLSDGSVVKVWPRTIEALTWIDDRDFWLDELAARAIALREMVSADQVPTEMNASELLDRIADAESLVLAMLVAQAAAPGLELGPVDEERLAWARALAPADVMKIYGAFMRVNYRRIMEARAALPRVKESGKPKRPMTWKGWLASSAARERMAVSEYAALRTLASEVVKAPLASPDLEDIEG